MNPIGQLHGALVESRRINVLAGHLAAVLPADVSVLDVGCGDGALAAEVVRRRPDLTVSGLEVLPRNPSHIAVRAFDGTRLPCADRSVDVIILVDVLHHTTDPLLLLAESCRVARSSIVIKDHSRDGWLAGPTLRLMDWVGNAHHGVALPYNYWTSRDWQRAVGTLGLRIAVWNRDLRLYPPPFRWFFDRELHFLAVLSSR